MDCMASVAPVRLKDDERFGFALAPIQLQAETKKARHECVLNTRESFSRGPRHAMRREGIPSRQHVAPQVSRCVRPSGSHRCHTSTDQAPSLFNQSPLVSVLGRMAKQDTTLFCTP